MSRTLYISVLGSPALTLNEVPVTGIAYSKALALVYYLAVTGRAHMREAVATLLWSEAAPEQSKKNLRDVLANLRRVLAPYLVITRQTVELDAQAAIVVDSRDFEAQLEAAQRATSPATAGAALRAAVELYRGDFLDGFYVGQAPEFEEWVLAERERLRRLALHALHTLARQAAQRGEYLEGIDYITRLLKLEPLHEEAHRQLMLLLALSGQHSAALAHFTTLRRTLQNELGADPDAETTALYEQILAGEIVDHQAAPALFLSPRPLHNLPASLTSFIGREAEVRQIVAWLQSASGRLLTIVGPGGVGKTTLALHAARHLVDTGESEKLFAHGVFFVSLTAREPPGWHDPSSTPMLLADALASPIADALGIVFSGPETPYTQLINYLRTKNLLLVLDNFEHLLTAADFITALLTQAPSLKILVTSRGRLNVHGEHILELDGLRFPNGHTEVLDWGEYSAIQLFQQSAQAVSPRFTVTTTDKTAITRICQLLNGLPLGIELAASWVRVLTCQDVAREIEANLNFLQTSRRGIPERHQSLRAVFEHSWDLLSEAERRVLRRLSLFRGGFDRTAAEYVCADEFPRWPPDDVQAPGSAQTSSGFLQLLAALVDNSLVRCTEEAGHEQAAVRYTLLEVIRQYAAEKLNEAQHHTSVEHTLASDRHCYYYLHFLCQRKEDMQGSRQQTALAEITTEIENIRSAWRWALARGHVQAIGESIESLFYFYDMRSWFREGLEAFTQAAARLAELHAADDSPEICLVWGNLLARQGWFTFHLGQQVEAKDLLERSLALLRPLDLPGVLVFPLNYLAAVNSYLGAYTEAQHLGLEGLAVSRAGGDRYGMIIANNILGQVAYSLGNYQEARRYFQESLAMGDRGNRWSMAFALINLGTVAYALGDYHEAQARFQEGLSTREALGDARGTALCLNHLGDTAEALHDYTEARRLYQRSLALFQEIGNYWGIASALSRLGYNALAIDDPDSARAYFLEALRAALKAQAPPRMLDALVGIATLLIGHDPERSLSLATFVRQHPSATQRSKDRAAQVCRRLALPPLETSTTPSPQPEHPQALGELVERLLHDAW